MRAGQPGKRDISRISEDDPGEREGNGMVHSGGGGAGGGGGNGNGGLSWLLY